MTATIFWILFAFPAVAAVFRPWIGILAYVVFAVLGPSATYTMFNEGIISTQKLLAGGTFIGWAFRSFRVQSLPTLGKAALTSWVLFLGVALLSALQSFYPEKSWWFWDPLWKLGVMLLLATYLLDTPARVTAVVWGVVLAQTYNACVVNFEYFRLGTSMIQVDGRHGLDNNTYALSTMPIMGLAAGLAIYNRKWLPKCIAGAALVLQVHQAILMDSRGALLSMFVLFFVGVVFMPKRWDTVGGALIVLIVGFALSGPQVVKRFESIYRSTDRLDASAASRFQLWDAGWRIMLDYPVLGAGLFAGERLVPIYTPFKESKEKALHNLFFDIGTGTGFIGVGAYLAFFGFTFWAAYSQWRMRSAPDWAGPPTLGALSGIMAYWAGSFFSSSALIESIYVLCAVVIATTAVAQRERLEKQELVLRSAANDERPYHGVERPLLL